MRQFLLVLFLLAFLPAAAKAVPYAEYDPATGDLVIHELRGAFGAFVRSSTVQLRSGILSEPADILPTAAAAPQLVSGNVTAMFTHLNVKMPRSPGSSSAPFAFDSIRLHSLVPPGTSVATLSAGYGGDPTAALRMSIVVVPEPSGLALAAIGAAAFMRRRVRS